jgi:hypothetical protein
MRTNDNYIEDNPDRGMASLAKMTCKVSVGGSEIMSRPVAIML